MAVKFLFDRFNDNSQEIAIIHGESEITYGAFLAQIQQWQRTLEIDVEKGAVVALQGDFSPQTLALFFALISHQCIVVPQLRSANVEGIQSNLKIAQVQWLYQINTDDKCERQLLAYEPTHPLLQKLQLEQQAGLILFTSGSSGTPKATVHNFSKLLDKFHLQREAKRIINFLLFDHWGGLNTMLHILSGVGSLICIDDRSADAVCEFIQRHRIQLLPSSPTFLNLLLLSRAYQRYDLSSLELITYGTEPMQAHTLEGLHAIFPKVKLQQTYGLIELGVMRSKSKSPESLWVKLGGSGFEWRVVDNILQIKAHSVMLGYLNAPSPFTDDGWFITGDYVEVDGEYLKILGRKSEIINVGGEKVFPVEVENVIQAMDNVVEVTVFPQDHPITGKVVCAKVHLKEPEEKTAFKRRLKKYCIEQMSVYKVPVRIVLSEESQMSQRLKKSRVLNQS